MNKKAKSQEGQCALTGKSGKFVKSHIFPQAFTRPSESGVPLYQSTRGRGELRRWSSWYDSSLVTRDGEDILSEIDDKAIKLLRRHQLVWSGWTIFRPYFEQIGPLFPDHGIRKIKVLEPQALIRFALSVAWRASASSLPDMQEATLEPELQERLRCLTAGEVFDGPSPFPVSLTQISDVGIIHNQSPYVDFKRRFGHKDGDEMMKIVRIYLDGLIIHVHFSGLDHEEVADNPLFIGASDSLIVSSVSYKSSFQYENMLNLMHECYPF